MMIKRSLCLIFVLLYKSKYLPENVPVSREYKEFFNSYFNPVSSNCVTEILKTFTDLTLHFVPVARPQDP